MALIGLRARGLDRTTRNLQRAAARARVENQRDMERVVRTVERDLKLHQLTGTKGSHPLFGVTGASGNTLGVRTGFTRRAVTARVFQLGNRTIGVVGTRDPKMKLHEQGGVITGNPWLRIPTRFAQTAAGVDRYAGQSARSIPGGFVFRSRAGNLWIARRRGRELEPMYLLKTSVRLRKREPFGTTLRRNQFFIRSTLRGGRMVAIANGRA